MVRDNLVALIDETLTKCLKQMWEQMDCASCPYKTEAQGDFVRPCWTYKLADEILLIDK